MVVRQKLPVDRASSSSLIAITVTCGIRRCSATRLGTSSMQGCTTSPRSSAPRRAHAVSQDRPSAHRRATVNSGARAPIRAGWSPRSHAVASNPHNARESQQHASAARPQSRTAATLLHRNHPAILLPIRHAMLLLPIIRTCGRCTEAGGRNRRFGQKLRGRRCGSPSSSPRATKPRRSATASQSLHRPVRAGIRPRRSSGSSSSSTTTPPTPPAKSPQSAAAGRDGVSSSTRPPLDLSDRGGFTGKTNACWAGAQSARGAWLLFTDADTVHEPGDLSRALHEAEKYHAVAALLLAAPDRHRLLAARRHAAGLLRTRQRLPAQTGQFPASPLAAANGQFLLVERDAYFSVGGHRVVGREILEDVALARAIKRAKLRHPLSLRPGRSRHAHVPHAARDDRRLDQEPRAALPQAAAAGVLARPRHRCCSSASPSSRWNSPPIPCAPSGSRCVILAIWIRTLFRFYGRVAQSNFPAPDVAISILGVPLFIWLLVRSSLHHQVSKSVAWKGRSYKTGQ